MAVSDTHPDGSFVKEIASLKHVQPLVFKIGESRQIIFARGAEAPIIYTDESQPSIEALSTQTLSSVVDFVRSRQPFASQVVQKGSSNEYGKPIGDFGSDELIVHVVSPTCVQVKSRAVGVEKSNELYLAAGAREWNFTPQYQAVEELIIRISTEFSDTPESKKLREFLSIVKLDESQEIIDNGTSQTVKTSSGLTRAENQKVDRFTLRPFRTFREVEQPESPFILRLKGGKGAPVQAALLLADATGWQMHAINSIGLFLRQGLGENVTILA